MNPHDIYKELVEIRDKFPKSSMMTVALIEPPGTVSTFDNAFQRTVVSTAKSGWSLEGKPPPTSYGSADDSVIGYVRTIADEASRSRLNLLVVIDLSKPLTSVWVTRRSMCFIATATYDSALAREVIILSEFRDEVLLTSKFGRGFVRLYYLVSPPLASAIDRTNLLKSATRKMLTPIVRLISRRMNRSHFHS